MYSAKRMLCNKLLWFAAIAAAVFGIFLAGWLVLFRVNRFSLEIQPRGNSRIILHYGADYRDPGADVSMRGSVFLKSGISPDVKIQVDGEVDPAKVGIYTLRYTAEYRGLQANATRTVLVVDRKAPVLTLLGDSQIDANIGDIPVEPGFTAWDEYDGDLTSSVTSAVEGDMIYYSVTDSGGNTATAARKICWHDPYLPKIHLTGGDTVDWDYGKPFLDPGYQATDNTDGDITGKVTVEGTIDHFQIGTYTLTYTVTDSASNTSTVTRTVVVAPVAQPEIVQPQGKVIYLTFDDGPSKYTPMLLDVLAKYDVKATFFVADTNYRYLIGDIVEAGHSIGIHTCSHVYKEIYASEEVYFADLLAMQQIIYEESGVMTTLMRFPGGSSNTVSRFNPGIMTRLTAMVTQAGFQYQDWNVDSGDTGGARDPEAVLETVTQRIGDQEIVVILQHDIKGYSVEAVESIILWGLENGYTFLPLEPSSPPFHHELNN